jgi:L-Ala-D/L-Glu epimerase
VMVGNMGGSTLAMAPGFVLGQRCDVVDLDGPYGLAEDPLAAEIYRDGMIFVEDRIWGAS